jgi:hypothetical protein
MQQAAAGDTAIPETRDNGEPATAVVNLPLECAAGYGCSPRAEAVGHRGCGEQVKGPLVLPGGIGQHHDRKR